MKIALFYHSLLSDWNHGNAHFLRGNVKELLKRGHEVMVYEPLNGYSYTNLIRYESEKAVDEFRDYYPQLESNFYDEDDFDPTEHLQHTDLVMVHEFNSHGIVRMLGSAKKELGYKLLFHDTHHRAVSDPKNMQAYDLTYYDGVLAFGNIIRDLYLKKEWTTRAWTWHEAADTDLFRPVKNHKKEGDLVWIGNWGNEERSEELMTFLVEPVKEMGLKADIYGVGYPENTKKILKDAGIEYKGYLPNHKVPETFSKYRMTLHIPRRYYPEVLPGIPTIRPFEAMACGIPLICAPWNDAENLFRPGYDYLVARNKKDMIFHMQQILNEPGLPERLVTHGIESIMDRHTCCHRIDELLSICGELGIDTATSTHKREVLKHEQQ